MARKTERQAQGGGRLRRAATAIKSMLTRNAVETADATETLAASPAEPQPSRTAAPPAPRATRREADIPMDVLDRAYTPPATSSKSSFRSDGADHQQDQELEFSRGVAELDWNDEDHFTNKSGDPRIGTRRRTYEPNETRDESRDEQR